MAVRCRGAVELGRQCTCAGNVQSSVLAEVTGSRLVLLGRKSRSQGQRVCADRIHALSQAMVMSVDDRLVSGS